MKKFNFRKSFTTILLSGLVLAFLSGLISCDNFLKGSEVRNALEESIKYAVETVSKYNDRMFKVASN